jgi:hypothetical protein
VDLSNVDSPEAAQDTPGPRKMKKPEEVHDVDNTSMRTACWQPIQFFLLTYKLPTPMSSELQIVVASFKQTIFSFLATLANLFPLSFHDCKRENFSFRGYISITI